MPLQLPDLNLTLGQLLWSVSYGGEADQRFKDAVRYLRLLGIPQAAEAQADGSGKRIHYNFFDLVEMGLAVTGLDLGYRPRDIAAVLVDNRKEMWPIYARAWYELPESALGADWVKSRGRIKVHFDDDLFLRFHDRRSGKWGEIDLIEAADATKTLGPFEPVERFGDDAPRRLVPLKRLMMQWIGWAHEAPEIRPGRKSASG